MEKINKVRQSNIELLRIISIILVLIYHIGSLIIKMPTSDELVDDTLSSVTRIFFANLSVVCVNVFVIISGWFGMRFTMKAIFKLLFQVFFVYLFIYAICVISGYDNLNFSALAFCFMADKSTWFVKAYLGLMIFVPALNMLVENGNEKQLRYVLVAFYAYQCTYGWITGGAYFLNWGFSVTSFAGLYLLSRYVRVYVIENKENVPSLLKRLFHPCSGSVQWLSLFLAIVIFDTVLYCALYYFPSVW